ncbi:MAG: lipocalin-like domain-containing protein [Chloroflexota bacterium]
MTNSRKIILTLIVIVAVAIGGVSLVNVGGSGSVSATTALAAPDINYDDFAKADAPYDWNFPEDFGAHPDFLTEWWYYTGNLATDDGRRFGFQFTIFRRAISPIATQSDSEWRTNQVYLAHFTVSDIEGNEFYHDERFSRGGAGLAGAESDPRYRVWVEDWEILAQNDDASLVTIQAETDEFSIDLTLEQMKPVALQGQNRDGLSAKSLNTENASYYYTIPRLETMGTITLEDDVFEVSGNTWKDHEFSTSALDEGTVGWDWFGMIFDDNTEMMLFEIRDADGGDAVYASGLLIYPDGTTEYLSFGDFTVTVTDTWLSPTTDATYPSGWEMTVPTEGRGTLNFTVEPLMRDQELGTTDPAYWEGAVRISGDVNGYGYAELTGYVDSMQNRF